jgi:hypothetical protein
MDILFELVVGFGVVGAVYYWVKTKYLNPEAPRDIEIFPSRGVPLVKRVHEQVAEIETEAAKVAESVIEKVEQVQAVADSRELVAEQAIETVEAEAVVGASVVSTQIPEDSVLKRHYLTQLAAERHAITNPYPSDSVLRRHFESMPAAKHAPIQQGIGDAPKQPESFAVDALSLAAPTAEMPQDSILKRHYQQLLDSQLAESLA